MVQSAAILSTGDELTTGRVVDTNAAYLADQLLDLGIEVPLIVTVGDRREHLRQALSQALWAADLVIMTGGLGPTSDDLTREVVSEFLSCPLIRNEGEEIKLERLFRSRGRIMAPNNLKQTFFPQGSEIIPNPIGTAPGFWISFEHNGCRKHLAALPGVPREMELMVRETLLPQIRRLSPERSILIQPFKLIGLSESELDRMVAETISGEGLRISFRANFPDLTLKIRVEGEENRPALEAASNQIRERLKHHIYAEREVDMETVVALRLMELEASLAVAESCTGGMLCERLTRVPGSSRFLKLGNVAYSEDAKRTEIGVSKTSLADFGAVSQAAAEEMADGVRRRCDADFGLGITGIAGPGGGTETIPEGTVWIGLATRKGVESKRELFRGERQMVRLLASHMALNWLRLKTAELVCG
jgi:nicotinamide-nucleotide amidase